MIEHWMTTGLLGANASFQRAAREYAEQYAAMAVAAERERCANAVRYWLAGYAPASDTHEGRCLADILEGRPAHGVSGPNVRAERPQTAAPQPE